MQEIVELWRWNLELVMFYRKIDVKRNNLVDYFHNLSWLSKIIFTFVNQETHERIW